MTEADDIEMMANAALMEPSIYSDPEKAFRAMLAASEGE